MPVHRFVPEETTRMSNDQREKAIELLCVVTDADRADRDEIEYKTNAELEEWVYGLGYAWNGKEFFLVENPTK